MSNRKITGVFAGSLILLASSFGAAQAQSVERPDVAVLNEHMQLHRVFVFDARGEQHALGFVGHDQLKYFDVPNKIEALGPYRIGVQQYLPVAGLGVSSQAFSYKMTPVLAPRTLDTVTIVVGTENHLSKVGMR